MTNEARYGWVDVTDSVRVAVIIYDSDELLRPMLKSEVQLAAGVALNEARASMPGMDRPDDVEALGSR